MIQTNLLVVVLAAALMIAGCARDGVIFATKTSLSILDADTTPAGISVAYDRVEGYLGPTNESGEAPAVLGYFASDGEFFRPNVSQVYATGNAARLLSADKLDQAHTKCSPKTSEKEKRVMFFGTSTTTGLKLGFAATTVPNAIPSSLVFGWQRKELSMVPLLVAEEPCSNNRGQLGQFIDPVEKGQNFYPATLGTINTDIDVGADAAHKGKMNTHQFFATGDAAVNLAKRPEVRNLIDKAARAAFAGVPEAPGDPQKRYLLVKCVGSLDTAGLKDIADLVKVSVDANREKTRVSIHDRIDALDSLQLQGLMTADSVKKLCKF